MASRLPAPARRRQLLEVAVDVFAERGFHPTSMNELAEAAGVTKPVLYQHFGSKRALYVALLDEVGSRLREAIAAATASAAGPHEQVEAGFAAYFAFVRDEHNAFRLLFGGGTRRDRDFAAKAEAVERSIATSIAALIAIPGLDAERRLLLAYGIVGMAESIARHSGDLSSRRAADRLAAQAAELAWVGLRGIRAS